MGRTHAAMAVVECLAINLEQPLISLVERMIGRNFNFRRQIVEQPAIERYEATVERPAGIKWRARRREGSADGETLGYTWPSARGESGKTREFRRNFDAEGWPSGRWRWS